MADRGWRWPCATADREFRARTSSRERAVDIRRASLPKNLRPVYVPPFSPRSIFKPPWNRGTKNLGVFPKTAGADIYRRLMLDSSTTPIEEGKSLNSARIGPFITFSRSAGALRRRAAVKHTVVVSEPNVLADPSPRQRRRDSVAVVNGVSRSKLDAPSPPVALTPKVPRVLGTTATRSIQPKAPHHTAQRQRRASWCWPDAAEQSDALDWLGLAAPQDASQWPGASDCSCGLRTRAKKTASSSP